MALYSKATHFLLMTSFNTLLWTQCLPALVVHRCRLLLLHKAKHIEISMWLRELKVAEILKILRFNLTTSWFQFLSLTRFWALFKSLLHVPCNNDEDKQSAQQNFYFYTATTFIKIKDVTKESKTQFSAMNIASQLAPFIHKEAKFS